MKIEFQKDDESQISVLLCADGKQNIFSYIDMIKTLIVEKKMDAPKITGDFSEAEISSIESMVTYINEELSDNAADD